MTPKEKAEQLFNSIYMQSTNKYDAKQCSLISVNELIEEAYYTDGYYDRLEYWEEVKQEIENK